MMRERDGMKNKNKYILSLSSPHLAPLLIIISVAAILCVLKEITMIQQEVSHLSSLAYWPECINPTAAAAARMAALYLSSLMHITDGCH